MGFSLIFVRVLGEIALSAASEAFCPRLHGLVHSLQMLALEFGVLGGLKGEIVLHREVALHGVVRVHAPLGNRKLLAFGIQNSLADHLESLGSFVTSLGQIRFGRNPIFDDVSSLVLFKGLMSVRIQKTWVSATVAAAGVWVRADTGNIYSRRRSEACLGLGLLAVNGVLVQRGQGILLYFFVVLRTVTV